MSSNILLIGKSWHLQTVSMEYVDMEIIFS